MKWIEDRKDRVDRRYGGWSKWEEGKVEWVGDRDGGLGARWGGGVDS